MYARPMSDVRLATRADTARLGEVLADAFEDDPLSQWLFGVRGVDPARQRTGAGTSLMQPVLDRADAERVLCHLETSKEENLAYYARHGFETINELELPPGAPRVWTMTRRPL